MGRSESESATGSESESDSREPALKQVHNGASAAAVEQAFSRYPQGMLVQQTMKGCFRNCLGCQAQQEYYLSDMDWQFLATSTIMSEGRGPVPNTLYILEESSCICRTCWRDGRPLEFNVTDGGAPGGAPVAKYTKPCGFPLYMSFWVPVSEEGDLAEVTCPCCCMLPTLSMEDNNGGEISKSEYLCRYNSCCIPQLMYYEDGEPVYYLAPDTCCGGFCVQCRSDSRKGCCQVPFLFHDASTMEKLPERADGSGPPQIAKVWAGLKKECCSTADNFAVLFPDNIDEKRKAGLLGLTLLLDFTVFERQAEG